MGFSNDDTDWMHLALAEARRGKGAVEPNPMVGAVVVCEGRMVGLGHHERFGGPHAEVLALKRAGESTHGATLYVTLEPCCHFGKTPPCTDAILSAGIARVVAAVRDPFPQVNGGGLAILEQSGIEVEVGCEEETARSLNAPYWKRLASGFPFVTAKWAMTLDGKTAVATGDSRWISSQSSRRIVHQIRGQSDAVIVGIGTVEADDPLLTARPPGPRVPVRVVLDSAARLSLESNLVRTAREIPVLVAVTERATTDRREGLLGMGCEVLEVGGSRSVSLSELLEELGRREMTNVLVEGGGRVLGSFLDAGQVDFIEVFVAPILEGGDHALTAVRGQGRVLMNQALHLREIEVSRVSEDIHIRGRLAQSWRLQAGFSEE